MVAMLRAQGTPARARCGFGGYFGNGTFEDHWVCEYWNKFWQRWMLVEARSTSGSAACSRSISTSPTSRATASYRRDAWLRCRGGAGDPATFGLSQLGQGGDWWIAGNLLRDAAALGNVEVLPWDCWGAIPAPGATIGDDDLVLFDWVARYTQLADGAFDNLQRPGLRTTAPGAARCQERTAKHRRGTLSRLARARCPLRPERRPRTSRGHVRPVRCRSRPSGRQAGQAADRPRSRPSRRSRGR